MRLDPKLVLAVSAGVLSACARDLDMPPPSSAPRIAAFSPQAAYAGETVVVAGSGFDSDPLGNLVQFGRASARADSASERSIAVRVPAGAGDGPFTVTTRGGVSGPSTAFAYLGRGELIAHAVVDGIPMLHKPYRVIPARDETFLHSDLLLGVVRYGDPAFVASTAVYLDQARWTVPDPSVVWLESDGSADVSRLVRASVDPGGAVATSHGTIPYVGVGPMAVVQGAGTQPDTVAVFDTVHASTTVSLRRLSDFSLYSSATTVRVAGTNAPVADLRNCVDAGGGDLACLGRATLGDPLTIFRLRIAAGPTATATFPATSPPGTLVENRFLSEDPLCADTTTHRAVAALSDGRLASIDVTGPTSFTAIASGSRTPARSLTCVPGATGYGTATGPTVLVSKSGDDLLTRLDPVTGTIRWTAAVPMASYAGLWCADSSCSAAGAIVHAAGEADNGILRLDLATGALLSRRTLDVGAGRVHAPDSNLDRTANQGAAWHQGSASGSTPALAFLTSSPPGVLEWPLTARRGSGLFPHFRDRPDAVAVVPWWTGHDYETVGSGRFVTDSADWGAASFSGAAQLAVDSSDYIHVGTTFGLESVDWTTGAVTTAPFAPAEYMSLQRMPDADVVAGIRAGNGYWYAAGWTAAHPGAMPPAWQWPPVGGTTLPWMVVAAVRLEGALQVFYWRDPGGTLPLELHAVTLTDAGVEIAGSDQALEDPFYSVIAVSPNGRTFVSWDFQSFSRDTSVVVWSGDAAAGFPRLATIPVDGQVAGAAFDATGEVLYVVTRGPDRIVMIQ